MDKMVQKVQTWLMEHYNGKDRFETIKEEDIDGIAGTGTVRRLIEALQIELNENFHAEIAVDGSFGLGTLKGLPAIIGKGYNIPNIVCIIQGSLWCKGYSAGEIDGIYGDGVVAGVRRFQRDAGINEDGIIRPYILQGIMNTDGYAFSNNSNSRKSGIHRIQLAMNKYYGLKIGLTAPNGDWDKKSQRNFIKCCQSEWGISVVDGVWGDNTMKSAPTLSKNVNGYKASKILLQMALTLSGNYNGEFTGIFDDTTYKAVYNFQDTMEIGADGVVGKGTWASLLSTRGNTSRKAKALDTNVRLTSETAMKYKNLGYTDVGRYLTNVKNGVLDKRITPEELDIIKKTGLKVFPIFQKYGRDNDYFTQNQGETDGKEAMLAAINLGFPSTVTIYFAIDYDIYKSDIDKYIVPYFKGIHKSMGKSYSIGVYGPRAVCNLLYENKLAEYSFVSDMSSGFSSNIGEVMPVNWAYEQFFEDKSLNIDKCMTSKRSTGVVPDWTNKGGNFNEIKNIYNTIDDYSKGLQTPFTPIDNLATIHNINRDTLSYLRSDTYDIPVDTDKLINKFAEDKDLNDIKKLVKEFSKGSAWDVFAGIRYPDIIDVVEKKYPGFDPKKYNFKDPVTGIDIEITHFAATLGAYNKYSIGVILLDQDENKLDSYTGWAGDLIQMYAIISSSLEKGYDYFDNTNLQKMIGTLDGELDGYIMFDKNGEEMSKPGSGFSIVDLIQDVDAFNIYKIYNLSEVELYNALNDYYYISAKCKKRYTYFKELLLKQFGKDSLSEIAEMFTTKSNYVMGILFSALFGDINEEKAEVVAKAFQDKIESLIENEK